MTWDGSTRANAKHLLHRALDLFGGEDGDKVDEAVSLLLDALDAYSEDAEILTLLNRADQGEVEASWEVPWSLGEHRPTLKIGDVRVTIFADGAGEDWDYVDTVTMPDGSVIDVEAGWRIFDWYPRDVVADLPGGPRELSDYLIRRRAERGY